MRKVVSIRSREVPQIILAGASNGSGHSQAAQNLVEVLRQRDPGLVIETINVYDFIDPKYRRVVEAGWEYVSLTPGLRYIYRMFHKLFVRNAFLASCIHRSFRGAARNLVSKINTSRLIHFVALHPAAVSIGVELKRQTGCQLTVIATDFVLHSVHCHDLVDRYVSPPRCFYVGANSAVAAHTGKIEPLGIPVADQFRSIKRYRLEEVGSKFQVLVSFGARGYRGLKNLKLLLKLIEGTDSDVVFTLLTGKDEVFREAAKEISRTQKERLRVLGFVDEPCRLLEKSHLIIGKAGGLTVSEAFASGLPMIVVDTLPGQEEYNARVVEDVGAGIWTTDTARILRFVDELRRENQWTKTRARILEIGRPESSQEIAELITPTPAEEWHGATGTTP